MKVTVLPRAPWFGDIEMPRSVIVTLTVKIAGAFVVPPAEPAIARAAADPLRASMRLRFTIWTVPTKSDYRSCRTSVLSDIVQGPAVKGPGLWQMGWSTPWGLWSNGG